MKRSRYIHRSRLKHQIFFFESAPLKTIRATIYSTRWIILLISLFIVLCFIGLLLTGGGENYIQIILSYSIAGFFTFFMGYFGWTLAQNMVKVISDKENKTAPGFTYYLKKAKSK